MIAAMEQVQESPSKKALRNRGGLDLEGYDQLRKWQAVLLAAHMIHDNMPLVTVRFMTRVYPLFFERKTASCVEMGRMCQCDPETARLHVTRLTKAGYFSRESYRAWAISDSYLAQINKMM